MKKLDVKTIALNAVIGAVYASTYYWLSANFLWSGADENFRSNDLPCILQ